MENTDPIKKFGDWLWAAERDCFLEHPNAMCLATVSPDGRPSARMVLLKGFNAEGFSFYTNYESPKARDLDSAGHGAICFYWDKLQRQVRVEGAVTKVSRADSETYFQSRLRASQVSAWASKQSQEISSLDQLAKQVAEVEKKYAGLEKLPLPEFWGGYLLSPSRMEFWQQADARRHERILFEKNAGAWTSKRLSP